MFSVSEHINADAGVVWKFLSEPKLMERWMPGIERLSTPRGQALSADSTLIFTARGAERTSEVVEFRAGRKITLQSVQVPVTATYRYAITPNGNGTTVSLEATCLAKGWGKIVIPLIRPMIRKVDGGQLRCLKTTIERKLPVSETDESRS